MKVSIAQPAYLPWAGYFNRISKSDVHVILDHVQFEKNSVVNRNKIRTAEGWNWLTVPIKTSGKFGCLSIESLQIDNSRGWAQKHWRSIQQSYRKSEFFGLYGDFFEDIYSREWNLLVDLTSELNKFLCTSLNMEWTPIQSSQLNLTSKKSELVLDICKSIGADEYLSGPFGRDYLDVESFKESNINVIYHDYAQPSYRQRHGAFVENMSVIDLLFNCGPESGHLVRK